MRILGPLFKERRKAVFLLIYFAQDNIVKKAEFL